MGSFRFLAVTGPLIGPVWYRTGTARFVILAATGLFVVRSGLFRYRSLGPETKNRPHLQDSTAMTSSSWLKLEQVLRRESQS